MTDGFQFVPFNDVVESTIEEDKDLYQYTYDDIMHLLILNKKLTDVEENISSFFDIYIVDALIGTLKFLDMESEIRKGKKTVKEASKELGISIDRYYRYRKKTEKKSLADSMIRPKKGCQSIPVIENQISGGMTAHVL